MSREKLMTAATINTTIDALYKKIRSALPADKPIGVIGIRTRGETLARRFVERLAADNPDLDVKLGVLDITFYRDDLSRRKGLPLVRATEIDFGERVVVMHGIPAMLIFLSSGVQAIASTGANIIMSGRSFSA